MDLTTLARPAPPRWAVVAAHLAVLCTLPAGLWRVAMALGVPVGFSADLLAVRDDIPGWGSLAVLGITVVQELVALLTLGLVRPWGEVVPRWLPLVGGARVPSMAAVVPAALGALVLTALAVNQLLLWPQGGDGSLSPTGRTVMGLCYLPLVLWGPLLGAVTVSYHRRHRTRS